MATEYRLSHTASEIDRKLSEIDNLGKVKTVNGVEPDESGNVVIEVSSGSGQNPDQSGLSTVQINALDRMFKVCAFTKADVSAEYSAFKTAFGIPDSDGGEDSGGDSSGGGEGDNDDIGSATITVKWESGTIGAGGKEVNNNARIRTAEYIPASVRSVEAADGYLVLVGCYDSTGAFGGYVDSANGSVTSMASYSQTIDLTTVMYGEYNQLIILAKRTDNADMGVTESENVILHTVAIMGISATYSGGEAAVGMLVTDLRNIVVVATFADGISCPVTEYTLSGTIAEGENTITVAYQEMTTTFVVVGRPNISQYAMVNGTHTFDEGTTVTVTNGNHVSIAINSTAASGGSSIVLSDITKNNQSFNISNAYNPPETWFALRAGDEVIVSYGNFEYNSSATGTALGFKETGMSSSVSELSLTYPNTSKTAGISKDVEVGNLFIYLSGVSAGDTMEFDVSVTVNGVKYV